MRDGLRSTTRRAAVIARARDNRAITSIYHNTREQTRRACFPVAPFAAFGGNMRFLPRRRLSRTDRCQSDGKSKKKGEKEKERKERRAARARGDEPPPPRRCSHDCLRGVDYLLYLFGRAFIALTRPPSLLLLPPPPPPPPSSPHSAFLTLSSSFLSASLSFDREDT